MAIVNWHQLPKPDDCLTWNRKQSTDVNCVGHIKRTSITDLTSWVVGTFQLGLKSLTSAKIRDFLTASRKAPQDPVSLGLNSQLFLLGQLQMQCGPFQLAQVQSRFSNVPWIFFHYFAGWFCEVHTRTHKHTRTHTEKHDPVKRKGSLQVLACSAPNRKAEKSIKEHHRSITGASHVPFPMTRHKLQDQGPNCPFLDLWLGVKVPCRVSFPVWHAGAKDRQACCILQDNSILPKTSETVCYLMLAQGTQMGCMTALQKFLGCVLSESSEHRSIQISLAWNYSCKRCKRCKRCNIPTCCSGPIAAISHCNAPDGPRLCSPSMMVYPVVRSLKVGVGRSRCRSRCRSGCRSRCRGCLCCVNMCHGEALWETLCETETAWSILKSILSFTFRRKMISKSSKLAVLQAERGQCLQASLLKHMETWRS